MCARAGAEWASCLPLSSVVSLHMDIAKVLAAAAQLKATEATVEVGEPTQLIVRGEVRTLFASTVNADEFERHIVKRLNAFKREEIRSAGRCMCEFDEKGIGKIQAEVEPTKARFFLPQSNTPPVEPKSVQGEPKGSFLGKLFGRK